MRSDEPVLVLTVVHEGRGGFIDIDGCRYPIEHIEQGRFCIHFPAGQRHARRDAHLRRLQQHVLSEPDKWHLDNRGKGKQNQVKPDKAQT
jgi:hypothetical protein